MKVFFASQKGKTLRENYKLIVKSLQKLGQEVLENQFTDLVLGKYGKTSPQTALVRDETAFKNSDILITEMTLGGFSQGYFYALASQQKKPVLILLAEGKFQSHLMTDLVKGSSSQLVSVEYYSPQNLEKILKKHLHKQKAFSTTKFNFIISPYIADYLDWVAHVKKKSKSDFLREAVIDKIIETDNEYQEFLLKKRFNL